MHELIFALRIINKQQELHRNASIMSLLRRCNGQRRGATQRDATMSNDGGCGSLLVGECAAARNGRSVYSSADGPCPIGTFFVASIIRRWKSIREKQNTWWITKTRIPNTGKKVWQMFSTNGREHKRFSTRHRNKSSREEIICLWPPMTLINDIICYEYWINGPTAE